jgi:hypothetical protein
MPQFENGRVSLDYDVAIDLVSENISISRANADINGIGLPLQVVYYHTGVSRASI